MTNRDTRHLVPVRSARVTRPNPVRRGSGQGLLHLQGPVVSAGLVLVLYEAAAADHGWHRLA